MARRYAVVRNATPADEAAAIETDISKSLDETLCLLSTEAGDPASVFVGDGLPYAVIEYKPEEARTRVLLTDWLDWTPLDPQTQQDISAFIAAKDLELGEQLQGAVLVQGWIELALSGSATPIQALMEQQLNTSYAASAANNGALSLTATLIPLIPDSVMDPADKAQFVGAIQLHFLKWPRPVDSTPALPPQVQLKSADFDYEVYVPAYLVDASLNPVTITLPPLASSGVLPYWWTRIKVTAADPVNSVTIAPDGAETIDGAGTLVLTAPGTVVLGGGPTEWHDIA